MLGGVADEIARIAELPEGPERDEHIDALVRIPERIARFLAQRLSGPELPSSEPMLTVLAQRHYRGHDMRDFREIRIDGRPLVVADYTIDDRPTHLVSTIGRVDDLRPGSDLVQDIASEVAEAGAGQQSVVDLYLRCTRRPRRDEPRGRGRARRAAARARPRARRARPARRGRRVQRRRSRSAT